MAFSKGLAQARYAPVGIHTGARVRFGLVDREIPGIELLRDASGLRLEHHPR